MTRPVPLSVSAPHRGGLLDLLRFAASAFIVLYHFGPNAPLPLDELSGVMGRGWLATDFFLLLSGYVLGRAYGRSLDDGRTTSSGFVARRLARVWPGQAVVLIGFVALLAVTAAIGLGPSNPERFGAADFFAQLGLAQAWGVSRQAGWNEPSWTLSALIVCYAAFPFVWRATRVLNGRAAALAAGLAVLAGGGLLSLAVLQQSLYDLPFYLGVFRAAPLFLAGLLAARFAAGGRIGRPAAFGLLVSATGLLVCVQADGRSELAAFVSMVAIATIVLASDALRLGGSRLIEGGARLSFALFITHALAGAVWFGLLQQVHARYVLAPSLEWAAWGGALVFALIVAWAFHRLIDAPVQAWLKARLDGVPPARMQWALRRDRERPHEA